MKKNISFAMFWLLLPMLAFAQIKISDPKLRSGEGIMAFVAKVENKGTTRIEGRTCMKFFDKDGFEIRQILGNEINLAPGGVETANGRNLLDSKLEKEITNAKLYFAKYGCISPQSDAVSNVLDIAYGPKGTKKITSTDQTQKNERGTSNEAEKGAELFKKDASGNQYYKATKNICEKANGLTQSFADGVASKLSVSASSIVLMNVKIENGECSWVRVDTPKGPLNCSIGSIVKTTDGDYLIHTYKKIDGAEYFLSGHCINF